MSEPKISKISRIASRLPFEEIKRDILTKKQADTSHKFGCDPFQRSVEELIDYGMINIDKPKGPTSHQVTAYAKAILGVKKAAHRLIRV